VTSRLLCTSIVAGLALGLAGCGDAFNAGPLRYVESPRLAADLKERPKLQAKVKKALVELYGNDPRDIRVPPGTGLRRGGIYLANYVMVDEKGVKKPKPMVREVPVPDKAGKTHRVLQAGGYSLYRLHCLHCHGVSGAGDGPTAEFLYPRPRDYRKGLFKFTSTPTGVKPTREDLRKTIVYGLHGTSMPAFESLMSPDDIEQVLDYVIFLSMRGETELALIDEAGIADENDPEALNADTVQGIAQGIFKKWKAAESQVVNPPVPKPPATRESILRGRDLFLSRNTTGNKVDCTSCHGPQAVGNGPSIVGMEVYNAVVFNGNISKRFELASGQIEILQALTDLDAAASAEHEPGKSETAETEALGPPTRANLIGLLQKRLRIDAKDKPEALKAKTGYVEDIGGQVTTFEEIFEKLLADLEAKTLVYRSYSLGGIQYHATIDGATATLWNNSLDDWRYPLRPANLNFGVYKGGRRPIDLYWRIAKGINGAKMPAHYPTIEPERIWDLVNFVLALPYEPKLLEGATLPSTPPAGAPKVAGR
jgi:mono/diheme cytochrome c family protein